MRVNVYDSAHGLAQAIKASEEFKQYDATKKQVDANEELSKMIKDFEAKQLEIQTKQMMGEDVGSEEMATMQQLYTIMARDPIALQYMEAEMRFSLMMKDVYQIVGEAIGAGKIFG
jgi:cell fate (sporulation/competence/biofilm development) regulator YlbF (YheA/YmcA/DUF963 family)